MTTEPYSRVYARFWIETKGWTPLTQNVALYLFTSPHRALEGLYHLPLGYLCEDLSLTLKNARTTLAFIEHAGMVTYDDAGQVVFLPKALKHQAPKTPNHIKGAVNRLTALPATCHWDAFREACARYAPALADAIDMACDMPSVMPSPMPSEYPSSSSSSSSNSSSKEKASPSSSDKPDIDAAHTRLKAGAERQVFDVWIVSTGRTGKTLLDPKRQRLIREALKRYPVTDVIDAVKGWERSPHHRGENAHGTPYNDLELLLRDAAHIEKFRDLQRGLIVAAPSNGSHDRPTNGQLLREIAEAQRQQEDAR